MRYDKADSVRLCTELVFFDKISIENMIYVRSIHIKETIMKTIVCYGVKNIKLRRRLQTCLSNEYEVIGFTDTYCNEDCVQGEAFIPIDKLMHICVYYIPIIAENKKTQEEISNILLDHGIFADKIVIPYYLFQENILYIPNLLEESIQEIEQKEIDEILRGLSYSLVEIDEEKLKDIFIDVSWYGLDMYYNYKIYSNILKYRDDDKIMFVFPYWYFGYDMSMPLHQYTTAQIFACRSLKDWHNDTKSKNKEIRNYLINDDMFGDRLWENKKWEKYCSENKSVLEGRRVLTHVWKNTFEDTRKENLEIYRQLLKNLKGVSQYLIVPPITIKNIITDEIQYINQKKIVFYECIRKINDSCNIKVFDYFRLFENRGDYEHLNVWGKQKFTELINKDILEDVSEEFV